MTKRKIMTMALSICMIAILAVGGTLAYFTDVDQNTNVFTVGDLKIDLYEKVNFVDGANQEKTMEVFEKEVEGEQKELGKGDDGNPNVKYKDIMPGDKMTKIATVSNEEEYPVYVALTIKQENYLNFNRNIDDYYEAKTLDELKKILNDDTLADEDAAMQKIINDIFPNWNLKYTKDDPTKDVRYKMTAVNGKGENVEIIDWGYANYSRDNDGNYYNYNDEKGTFVNGLRIRETEAAGNFDTITGLHDRVWIVYLKMAPKTTFTMDLTTVCPTYVTTDNVQAFENMALDVRAAAIQVDGFADHSAAFEELFETYDFAY